MALNRFLHLQKAPSQIQAFFINNTFISNARLKLLKNKPKSKQHPEAELLFFENYSHSSSTLSSKINKQDMF